MTAPLPNPWVIDQRARTGASVLRALAYAVLKGQQGVLESTDLAVTELDTPGAGVNVAPGLYGINNTASGGTREAYVGKVDEQASPGVSPTDSSGGRTDLVIARIQNPDAVGTGLWPVPADAALGPYAVAYVVEGVTANINSVVSWNDQWTAIPLARIERGPNTGIVVQGDITDLRSLVDLSGERITIINNPPADAPPIAQSSYVQFQASAVDPNYAKPTGGSDNAHDYLVADTATKNWPSVATWQVPVPSWAVECDAEFQVFNAQILDGDVFGDLWLDFGGTATATQTYAIDYDGTPGRWIVPYGRTFTVPSSLRGKVITVRTKLRSRFAAPGRLDAKTGATTKLSLNFQRVPDF